MEKKKVKAVNKIRCHCVLDTESSTYSVSQRQQPRQAWKTLKPCGPLVQGDDTNLMGFTLIELLVVVLIIGILAAVAVPQYQKSVEKSKATQAITLLKSVYQAADAYYLANGTWPTSFDVLDVDIPWTGHTVVYGGSTDPRSNNDWSLEIFKIGSQHGIVVTRLNGKYKGGQFVIYKRNGSSLVPPDTLLCQEEKASTSYIMETAGLYCQQLFQGTYITQGSGNRLYFFGK